MQATAFVAIGCVVFGVVSLAHLARLIFALDVIIGTFKVPMWISAGGFVVAGCLAVWAGVILFSNGAVEG